MPKIDACVNCFCSREQSHREWIGKVAAGGPDGDVDDEDNWANYTTIHCHRYPESIEVTETHWCREYEPDSIGGNSDESKT